MFRSALLRAIALAATLLAPAAAQAAAFSVDGWQGQAANVGGVFNHCVMAPESPDSGALVVALTPDGDVGLGVVQPGSEFEANARTPLAYRAGDHVRAQAMAQAVAPETMLAWFDGPDYSRHLVPISNGGSLVVSVGERQQRFHTTPSEDAIQALIACVQTNLEQRTERRARHFMEMFRLQ